RGRRAHAQRVVRLGLRRLAAGQYRSTEERPPEAFAGPPDEGRLRDREGQYRPQPREQRDLALARRDGHLPAWKAKDPALVDEPDRVVPALPEQTQRIERELGKLHREDAAHECVFDRHLGGPLVGGQGQKTGGGGRLQRAARSSRVSGAPIFASRRRRAGARRPPTMRPTGAQWSRRRSGAGRSEPDLSVTLIQASDDRPQCYAR